MEIKDEQSLAAWLSDKPDSWAQAIALRAALRALPYIGLSSEHWLRSFALLPFVALITSWMQLVDNSHFVRSDKSRANAKFGGELFDFKLYKSEPIAACAADSSYYSADAQSRSMHVLSDCVKGVSKAVEALHSVSLQQSAIGEKSDQAVEALWVCIRNDCRWLIKVAKFGQPLDTMHVKLVTRYLWIGRKPPRSWHVLRTKYARRLRAIDSNFSIWTDWYERRFMGKPAAFDIPGDDNRIEDRAILHRLAEVTNEDFSGKDHEYVNAALKGWLDEARARVAPVVPQLDTPQLPAPNPNAISFRGDPDGKIAIDGNALRDRLRTDKGALDRYAEAVSEARAWLARCGGSNTAARLSRFLENYLAAAGENIESANHSLLVQRGERLRQELARYDVPDNMLPPVADDLLLDGKGWQSAHNMMVGLDPVLHAADIAMLGPDQKPTLIPPEEFRAKAHEADEADILADGVVDIIDEAADLAPAVPDPENRRSVAFGEMARNLIIEAFAVALNHPIAAGGIVMAGVAIHGALGAGGVGAISIMGSIRAAEYLVCHKAWILARLGNTPTWQALLAKLAERLEKNTPFEPK